MPKLLLTFLIFMCVAAGCCRDEMRFSGETDVSVYEPAVGVLADTIRGPFRYEYHGVYAYAMARPTVHPAQLLMAFSCDEVYDREIVEGSERLWLDRGLFIGGVPVAAGEDLLPVLRNFTSPYPLVNVGSTGFNVYFDAALLEVSDIAPGMYSLTGQMEMEGGLIIERSYQVYLDL